MKDKKRLIIFIIIAVLSLSLALIALFTPMVHLVGKDSNPDVVYDKSVSLVTYLIDSPFLNTDAFDVYFNATGPIWMATGGLLLNIIVFVSSLVLLAFSIFEVVACKKQNLLIKHNILAKKVGLFTGYLAIFVGLFETISFIVTTMMSNGFVEFNLHFGSFLLMAVGLLIVILSYMSSKRTPNELNRTKNIIGYLSTGLLALLTCALIFIPQYALTFDINNQTSMWGVSNSATLISGDAYIINTMGDYPFGFAQWAIILTFIPIIFVFIYSLIGFILTLKNKSTNWLSARVKRWSMTILIMFVVLYTFMFLQAAVWQSNVVLIDETTTLFFIEPYVPVLMIIPFMPYVFSTLVSYQKKNKKNKDNIQTTNLSL